jgi:hypothetical protein
MASHRRDEGVIDIGQLKTRKQKTVNSLVRRVRRRLQSLSRPLHAKSWIVRSKNESNRNSARSSVEMLRLGSDTEIKGGAPVREIFLDSIAE